jgi:hypothetical protein
LLHENLVVRYLPYKHFMLCIHHILASNSSNNGTILSSSLTIRQLSGRVCDTSHLGQKDLQSLGMTALCLILLLLSRICTSLFPWLSVSPFSGG